MFSESFIDALVKARRRLPQEAWRMTIERLSEADGTGSVDQLIQTLAAISNQDIAWLLGRTFEENSKLSWGQIAAAMSVVDGLVKKEVSPSEIIWSGPPNGLFPVRRIDQVLYDLVNRARERILLVTFAANRIERFCNGLQEALFRGVSLTLILEAEQGSEGQLGMDALGAFSSIKDLGCKVYYWPLSLRERNAAGRPGKLHAKCAVIDFCAIVGSANLTDDAFSRNLELGLRLNDPVCAQQIFSHFKALVEKRILVEVER